MKKFVLAIMMAFVIALGFTGCGGETLNPNHWDFTDEDDKFRNIQNQINELNAAIAALQEQLDSLKGGAGDNVVVIDEETINNIINNITELQGQVEDLQEQLAALEGRVEGNEDAIAELEGKCNEVLDAIDVINGRLDAIEAALEDLNSGGGGEHGPGSLVFTGTGAPGTISGAIAGDFYIDLEYVNGFGYDMYLFNGEEWVLFGYIKKADPTSTTLKVERAA